MESLNVISLINLQTLVLANEYFPFFPCRFILAMRQFRMHLWWKNLRTKETCQAIELFKLTLFQT